MELLGEMFETRSEVVEAQDDSRTCYSTRKQGSGGGHWGCIKMTQETKKWNKKIIFAIDQSTSKIEKSFSP